MGKKVSKKEVKEIKKFVENLGVKFEEFKAASKEEQEKRLQANYENFKKQFPGVYGPIEEEPQPEPEPEPTPEPTPDPDPTPNPEPQPTPEPEPSGNAVNVSEKWATGQDVDIMKGEIHKDGDGDKDGYIFAADPKLYASHAGGGDSADRAIIMKADGTLSITGDMARAYNTHANYNAEWEMDVCRKDSWAGEKFDSGNISLKGENRHQYGGANSNKNGGVGVHFGEDYVGSSAELEHGTNVGIAGDKKYPNGQKLKLGEKYHVKFTHYDEPDKVNTKHVRAWVDFNDGNGLVQVLDVVKKLPASLFQQSLYEGDSSIWYRNNGSGTSEISNVRLSRL